MMSPSGPAHPTAQVMEVIPPREHGVDELASELMLGALGNEEPVSLEIAADASGIKFLYRGEPGPLESAQHQLQATYTQARFRPVPPDEDPARPDTSQTAMAKLTLRRPCYLPLVTFRDGDFLTADPLRGLLGVLSHLQEGERLLAQLILRPAPRDWADRFASYSRPASPSGAEPLTFGVFIRQFASILVFGAALGFSLCSFFSFVQRNWLVFLQVLPLTVVAVGAFVYLFYLALKRSTIDAELVQIKIRSAAYDVSLRLAAYAPTLDRARVLRRELALAYREFDRANGNALVARPALFDPRVVEVEPTCWWNEFRGCVNRLNVAELAALWHLPLDRDVPLVERTQAKRLLPLPQTVREGILIGQSDHAGHRYPVHMSQEALWGHVFMVAKTQAGKSTLMGHLATAVMRQTERRALVVIDPHGDLVRSLLPLVPRERVSDVVYVDFSEKERVIGLNLLDVRQGRDEDLIVSNIIHVGELVWSEFWGPRMEDVLRFSVRTLLTANQKLIERGEPQFTILDVPPLLQLANFRHRVIGDFIKSKELLEWWTSYFEPINPNFQLEIINPVLTKLHRFAEHTIVRLVAGQSSSTVNFRELLNERKILLVNTATGIIGGDAGNLLGAVIVDFVNFAVREQMAIPDSQARARVVLVLDEFQSTIGIDYQGLLAELQKMGAGCMLATQALGQLKAISAKLHASIFSNIASLFVFQTSAEDAEFLAHELDDEVSRTDIINLPDYSCYLKTKKGHERLPTMYLQTSPPEAGDAQSAERIIREMGRYTYPASMAASDRDRFQTEQYGRELEALRKLVVKGKKEPKEKSKPTTLDSKESPKGPETGDGHPTGASDTRFAADAEPKEEDVRLPAKPAEPNASPAEAKAQTDRETGREDRPEDRDQKSERGGEEQGEGEVGEDDDKVNP